MKKSLYTIALCALALAGCTKLDSFLDTKNYQAYDTSSFPTTQEDADDIITGIYSHMTTFYQDPENSNMFRDMIASDDLFGGGSTSNVIAQATDRFMENTSDASQGNWGKTYAAIFRCNYALESIPQMDDALFTTVNKNYLLGQAYFMRAWFNWDLASKFETFPLKLTTAVENLPRASVDEIYQAITNDLLKAIELMPANYKFSNNPGMSGRATKYAAEAALGRIWLFYTGFYKKSDMFGVTKAKVVEYLKDCRDNSGFGLVDDPREIWPYTNEFGSGFAYGTDFETYVSKNNLHWEGDWCKETIWGVHFSYVYTSGNQVNRLCEYMGLRNSASSPNALCYPYGIGYTNGTVNSNMVEAWYKDPDYGPADKRLFGSVLVVDNADEIYDWISKDEVELPNHPGNDSKEVEKTMFHQKKYTVSTCWADASKSSLFANFYHAVNSATQAHNQFGSKNDMIYIRYADVLLMLDELEGPVDGMNKLRARAGLQPYSSYSLEKLQKERRYELAFEGVRFNDLRRWYGDQAGQVIYDSQKGAWNEYRGVAVPGGWRDVDKGDGLVARYAKTRGFWMVSQTEINLSEDVMTQTPGFGAEDKWMYSNGDLPH